ncbi:exodeoxyribonuclease VII large subunit [Thauera propionica]|uniref:Exodeoxyribonuclease VII large subunit n=1 Tax=Thauera propionica TaxID=2019431 RepID=A0A235EV83_9RHOO|nr:exodeoxyribonuclease VII large subunit [Thauera propionica]OYD52929.1 exodeoxyribonuclease VII large subunit [Thauera propionica]
MPTYLTTTYQEREQAKALGARWDGGAKRWYVPDGLDPAPFAKWLPSDHPALVDLPSPLSSALPATQAAQSSSVTLADKGMSLSSLLAGVAQAVAQAYEAGVWAKVEVTKIDSRRGHVYLELAERTGEGVAIAQARAMIWATTANKIIPVFERVTGSVLTAGIKLLVRAKPTFHAQYGFSLVIEEIDPEFTLGELEARKREIRARLQREGLFDLNRRLTPPWDFNQVLVVAPQGAAGLGDFDAEARRLQEFGVCAFEYAHSRFQGEGAAFEIRASLLKALASWPRQWGDAPDAIVIIRGGGAVNDLAWLNDYDLARCVCEAPAPVFAGIGHERDSTILDEVANRSFDTPSKVIHGIEQTIRQRTSETKASFEMVSQLAERTLHLARSAVAQRDTEVNSGAQRTLGAARDSVTSLTAEVRLSALQTVRGAAETTREALHEVKHEARSQLAQAKETLPTLLTEVRIEAHQALEEARGASRTNFEAVRERGGRQVRDTDASLERTLADVGRDAKRKIEAARVESEAFLREIAGQGPQKTLNRGFAIVKNADGKAVTSASHLDEDERIEIQFRDGSVPAQTRARKQS